MKQVGSIMQVRAEEKGLHFRMDYEALAAATYLGDEARVRQILLNLIGNAIKFTEAGQVALEVVRNDGEIHFRVTDTGIGIPTAHLEKIFNKFEQADNSTTRKYGGSGLGLAISQTLARLMGGRIEVTSEMNQGSVFTLIVPDHTETQASSAPVSVAVPAEISDRPLAGKRVLIAEDFENNLMVMQYFMESLGASFDVARNGREALTLYREQPYDIVLMDVQMPEMDGIKATKEIRAYEVETSRSPAIIIAMTAHALAGDASRCLEAGMDDYLSKPLVEGDIRTKIQHLLAA
jgi:CheY-like chemotaxis protein